MSKRDWMWIVVRVFGLYLLVQVLFTAPWFVITLVNGRPLPFRDFAALSTSQHLPSQEVSGLEHVMSQELRTYINTGINCGIHVVLCTALGLYLVAGGKRLVDLLCREKA